MTLAETPRLETPRLAACPGCLAAPDTALPLPQGGAASAGEVIHLSLPSIHCAGCIATVERGLLAREEVHNARVNLNRKQVVITTRHGTSPEALMDHLTALGIEAHLLDLDALGQDGDRDGRALLIRIAIAGFAMMNVMLMSVAVWSGASDATRDLFHWLSAAITLPALAYAAQPFFRNAWVALRVGCLNMDVPISLALVLTAGMSVYETAAGGHAAYFDATLSLTCFLLIGRYLDHRCRANARSAAKELAALEVPRLLRKTATGRETINLSQARQGDHILVLPGARVPVDGMVIEGRSNLDRALLTGESLPVAADVGTMVSAGEVNLSGPLTLRATAVGADTSLRRMVTMIDAAESARNRYTALADRAAALYAPAVHLLAFATFLGWIAYAGDIRHALNIAVSVLIITCPCALGLAVPAVSTAAAGLLFRRGLLVKNGTALERIAETDVVVFDKTGTLTEGQLAVDAVNALPESALVVALALAQASTHPVSRALALGLETRGIAPAPLSEISETSGKGVQAIYKGQQVLLGAAGFVGVSVGASVGSPGSESHGAWLRIGESAPIFLPLRASLRQGAARMIAQLQATGTEIHLISGDTPAATQAVASALGIPQARAGQSPADKIAYLDRLAASGRRVLMVGDGLNDTGALAAAYASVAPASAADAARAASDVVMLGQSLSALPDLINTARSAKRRILENFAIAAVYNALVIPFAMVGYVTPLVAAIAMSGSSIVVLLNAMRLQKGARA
ncbi:MAG: Cu2+-exporting ATPase [Sulfitobacter sp.]|jgi:Cu2+-exporting ATPase